MPRASASPAYPPCPNLIRAPPKAMSIVILRPNSTPLAAILALTSSVNWSWNGGSRGGRVLAAPSAISVVGFLAAGFFFRPFLSLVGAAAASSSVAPRGSAASWLSPFSPFSPSSLVLRGARFRSLFGGLMDNPPGDVTLIALSFPLASVSISNSTGAPSV